MVAILATLQINVARFARIVKTLEKSRLYFSSNWVNFLWSRRRSFYDTYFYDENQFHTSWNEKKSWTGNNCCFFLLFHVSRISDDQTRGKGGKPWSHLISDQRDEISFLLLRFFLYKSVSISGTLLWYLHDQKCSHHNSWNNFILSSRGASRKFRASSLFGKAKTRSKGKSHF